MRKMKKSSDITEMNKLRILHFELMIDDDPVHRTLHMVGQNDIPYQPYFFVDVQFIETVYMACAPYFDWFLHWRLATDEEAAMMREKADEEGATVYCVEQIFDSSPDPQDATTRTFFIVAWGLNIIAYYDEEVEFRVRDFGHPA